MVGVCKVEIHESAEDLKALLREQKSAASKERVHLLYLLKSRQVKSVTEASRVLGRNRVTLERWLGKYREGGLERLLVTTWKRGRKREIPDAADAQLQARLRQPEGFTSYGAIQQWLADECNVHVSYPVVHRHVRYRLQAKLKVPRPVSRQQCPEELEDFKKNSQSD